MDEPLFAAGDIQGNIAPGFATEEQRLLGLRLNDLGDVAAARLFLGQILPLVTPMATVFPARKVRSAVARGAMSATALSTDVWLNVALNAEVLTLLGQDQVARLDKAFEFGMGARSYALGDPREPTLADGSPNPGHRSNWVAGGPDREIHLLLTFGGSDAAALDARAHEVLALQGADRLDVVFDQPGVRRDTEHFGFVDGLSQPGPRGLVPGDEPVPLTKRFPLEPRAGEPEFSRPGQPLVWPGQYLLGHPTQLFTDYRNPGPVRPGIPPFAYNGSFLVFRRLRQDVAAFYQDTDTLAAELAAKPGFEHITPALLRALIVGRWPSGQPVMRSPGADQPSDVEHRDPLNHFQYARPVPDIVLDGKQIPGAGADMAGRVCPVLAHIRKVNPRDLPTDQGPEFRTLTFQMLRRGFSFGPPFDHANPSSEQNRAERGLAFVSYQASIENQFEILNNKWMNLDGGPQSGGLDLLVGQNSTPGQGRVRTGMLYCDSGQTAVSTTRPWVVPTGGGYFFAPSISSLAALARGG